MSPPSILRQSVATACGQDEGFGEFLILSLSRDELVGDAISFEQILVNSLLRKFEQVGHFARRDAAALAEDFLAHHPVQRRVVVRRVGEEAFSVL